MTSTGNRPIAIISAPGSRGDVNPMVAIGAQLRACGFDVVISLAENYLGVAEEAGLVSEPLISREAFEQLIRNPNIWRPLRGISLLFRDAANRFLEPHLNLIKKHHRPGQTVLIAHPLDFASRIYRDFDPSTPMVSVHLSPAIVRNAHNPPRLLASRPRIQPPPWFVESAYWLADILLADRLLGPTINLVRKTHGLKPVSRVLDRWWLSPDLVLGMYPSWFSDVRPPCEGDWVTCGFPLPKPSHSCSGALTTLPSNQPIIAIPGTAHVHADRFFNHVMEASRSIDRKCILVTNYPSQLPEALPKHASTVTYAPLNQWLPHCGAIIHHGGIGTTAISCATACPQLICPMAYDQFHNADRIEAIGLGKACQGDPWKVGKGETDTKKVNQRMVSSLADQLHGLIDDAKIRTACNQFASLDGSFRGAENAATLIANLLASKR